MTRLAYLTVVSIATTSILVALDFVDRCLVFVIRIVCRKPGLPAIMWAHESPNASLPCDSRNGRWCWLRWALSHQEHNHTHAATDARASAAGGRESVAELSLLCDGGEELTMEQLVAAHADPIPIFLAELKKLRIIQQAMERAEQETISCQQADPRRKSAEGAIAAGEHVRIRSYALLHRVGKGGFGEVWLARNRFDGQCYALKLIPKENAIELDGIHQYKARARGNPYLVPSGPPEEADEFYYYTMPLADDAKGAAACRAPEDYEPLSLRCRLARSGALTRDELLTLARQILTGLELLHANGGTHCDVKPDNIMQFDGVWKLGDQGLLAASDRVIPNCGTPGFWPPEGIHDHTADLYALGKTLYLAMTGAPLSRFDEFAAGKMEFTSDDPRDPALRQIILKACSPRPGRFTRANEMLVALDRLAGFGEARSLCTSWI